MRIIGGKFRSRVLAEFGGKDVRPTSDRVKESLFNILSLKVRGARVLDLFSGSGALGLECLSRGAAEVTFNDCAKESIAILQKNLTALKLTKADGVILSNADYAVCLERQIKPFDLIFIDPPYMEDYGVKAVKKIAEKGLLSKDGIIVFERHCPFGEPISGLEVYDIRKYGKAVLSFLRNSETGAEREG